VILQLADRFHALPSRVLEEDVELIRWLELEAMIQDEDEGEGVAGDWE
jgi:hypothetical protein